MQHSDLRSNSKVLNFRLHVMHVTQTVWWDLRAFKLKILPVVHNVVRIKLFLWGYMILSPAIRYHIPISCSFTHQLTKSVSLSVYV